MVNMCRFELISPLFWLAGTFTTCVHSHNEICTPSLCSHIHMAPSFKVQCVYITILCIHVRTGDSVSGGVR